MKTLRLSRRACLRGAGASLALPALEVMAPSVARAQAAPLRFLCVFSPNGFLMNKWTPAGTGTDWATPPLLTALEPYRGTSTSSRGLGNYTASIASRFGGSHTRATGSLLTQYPIAFSSARNPQRHLARPDHRHPAGRPHPLPLAAGRGPRRQPHRRLRGRL